MNGEEQGAPEEGRSSPLLTQALLLIGFIIIAVTGVITVAMPELRGEEPESEVAESETTAAPVEALR